MHRAPRLSGHPGGAGLRGGCDGRDRPPCHRLLTGISRCSLRMENGIFALRGKLVYQLAWKHHTLLRVSRQCVLAAVGSLSSLAVERQLRGLRHCEGVGSSFSPRRGGEETGLCLPGPQRRSGHGRRNHGGSSTVVHGKKGKGAVRMERNTATDPMDSLPLSSFAYAGLFSGAGRP